jgi:F0F1-type ATP synthase assembly protein I
VDEPAPDSPGEDRRLSAGASAFLGLGLSVAVCMAVSVGLGMLADSLAHTSPAFLLVGLAVGVVLSVLLFVSTVRKYL